MWGFLLVFTAQAALAAPSGVPDTPDQKPDCGPADVRNIGAALQGIKDATQAAGASSHCVPGALSPPEPACPPKTRMLTLNVEWSSRAHRFLQNPQLRVSAIGPQVAQQDLETTLSPVEKNDARASATFTLDARAPALTFDWSLSFHPKLRLNGMRAAREAAVFSASQKDTILWPPCGEPSWSAPATANALVTESFDAARATLTVTVDTSFVDLTDLWHDAAAGLDRESENAVKVWEARDPNHSHLRMIGSTRGAPALWSAYLVTADADSEKADLPVSRVVIYPQEIDHWDPVIGLGDPRHTLYYANKFFITDCKHPSKHPAAGTECYWLHHSWGGWTNWVPPGFGAALEATGKRALLLMPWTSAAKGTAGPGFDLPDATLAIAHLMQSEGRIAAVQPLAATKAPAEPSGSSSLPPAVTSPLVLASFSGGADAWYVTFDKFKERIDGMWGFDPITHTPGSKTGVSPKQLDAISEWLARGAGRTLRISDSMYETLWSQYFRKLGETIPPARLSHDYIQGSTDSMRWYGTQNVGTIDPGWALHQFSVNGGTQDKKGNRTSFFEQFSSQLP